MSAIVILFKSHQMNFTFMYNKQFNGLLVSGWYYSCCWGVVYQGVWSKERHWTLARCQNSRVLNVMLIKQKEFRWSVDVSKKVQNNLQVPCIFRSFLTHFLFRGYGCSRNTLCCPSHQKSRISEGLELKWRSEMVLLMKYKEIKTLLPIKCIIS